MSGTFRAACVQLNSGNNMAANIDAALRLTRDAIAQGAQFVMTPEYTALLDGSGRAMREGARLEADHPALTAFCNLAGETGAWLLIGSLTMRTEEERIANRSYLISGDGVVTATYDKIHMFDVTLPDGRAIKESSAYRPGDTAILAQTPWGALGLTVCYDLRFPAIYRALAQAGADFLSVPSAFTAQTGPAHWHALLRARAIENTCFVFAPAMCGTHPGNRATYGHSLIVDPWGEILAEAGEDPGIIFADIDCASVAKARAMIPSLRHDRPFALERH